ncbi:MAG: alcohol dehydrogenase, partial [Micrococcus sp.]|nr:alcohol dehydrogenase [Micrococcus sp.]
VAQGWATAAREAGTGPTGAAVVIRVKTLAGLEQQLAERFVRLWSADAGRINDSILELQEKETA